MSLSVTAESVPTPSSIAAEQSVSVRAVLAGDRLDVRGFENGRAVASVPTVIALGPRQYAVLLRYGVIVVVGLSAEAEADLLAAAVSFVIAPSRKPDVDEAKLILTPDGEDDVDATGAILLKSLSIERLQVIAEVLAKNVVLAHYETTLADAFDRIEPLAAELKRKGRTGRNVRALLRQIGDVLLIEHRMVGRAEPTEKPEVLWNHPELERLYAKLEAEYELPERARALEAKLGLVSRTCETLLGLVQHKQSLRVYRWLGSLYYVRYCLCLIGRVFSFPLPLTCSIFGARRGSCHLPSAR